MLAAETRDVIVVVFEFSPPFLDGGDGNADDVGDFLVIVAVKNEVAALETRELLGR